MTTPESRDKLNSILTHRQPNLLQKVKVRQENSFVCVLQVRMGVLFIDARGQYLAEASFVSKRVG